MTGQIVFIVWRESVEALLVIGILDAWLRQQAGPAVGRGRRYLWFGAGAGALLATLLGGSILFFSDLLPENGQEYFQTAMVLIAAALILQMVFWMRRRGHTLKRDLEAGAQRSMATANWWGLFVLALVAVAREGSETVVFLYGMLAAATGGTAGVVLAIGIGFALAVLTYFLLQLGGRYLSWRLFFRVTEVVLLFLAAALVMSGVDHLIALGVIPPGGGALWDTSGLLDDTGPVGGFLASLTGYRARPDLLMVLVYAIYWAAVVWALVRKPAPRPKVA